MDGSGELPSETFMLDGTLIGFAKPHGHGWPFTDSKTWYRFARIDIYTLCGPTKGISELALLCGGKGMRARCGEVRRSRYVFVQPLLCALAAVMFSGNTCSNMSTSGCQLHCAVDAGM